MAEFSGDLMAVLNGVQTFLLILGGLFGVAVFLLTWQGNAARSWPSTKGRVLISEVHKLHRGPKFFARVRYEYTIRRKTFKRRMITFGDIFTSHTHSYCKEKTDRYPQGEEVTVYYHPDMPGISVLEPGVNKKIMTHLISKVVIVGVCYLLVFPDVLQVILEFFREIITSIQYNIENPI